MSDTGRGTTPLDPKDAEIERLKRENARIMQEWAISEGLRTGIMQSDDVLQSRLNLANAENVCVFCEMTNSEHKNAYLECCKDRDALRARLEQAERNTEIAQGFSSAAINEAIAQVKKMADDLAALRAREKEARGLLKDALDLIRRMHDDEELADPPQIVIAIRAWLDGGKEAEG